MKNPFVLLVGCSRSGTTLLQKVTDSHPKIAILPETRWFVRWYEKRLGLTAEDYVTPELVTTLLRKLRLFRDVDTGLGEEELLKMIESGRISYADFVTAIFDQYGKVRGKPLVGNKTPGHVRRLATIHKLWPHTKIVHIIRDGRDVCLSAMNQWREKPDGGLKRYATFRQDPLMTAAFWWERNVRLGKQAGRTLGPKLYYEMRYEALVGQPRQECEALCAFLGVPFDEAMMQHNKNVKVRINKRGAIKHGRLVLPITPGLRDWRTEMPLKDVERFEAAAGSFLEELGYPRGAEKIDPALQEHAAELRNVLEESFRRGSVLESVHD
jgi:hypothetical protein